MLCSGVWGLVVICFYLNTLSSFLQYHTQELPALPLYGKCHYGTMQGSNLLNSLSLLHPCHDSIQFHIKSNARCYFMQNPFFLPGELLQSCCVSRIFFFLLKAKENRRWLWKWQSFHKQFKWKQSTLVYFGLQHNFSFEQSDKKKGGAPFSRKKKPERALFSEQKHSEVPQITFFIKLLLYHRPD